MTPEEKATAIRSCEAVSDAAAAIAQSVIAREMSDTLQHLSDRYPKRVFRIGIGHGRLIVDMRWYSRRTGLFEWVAVDALPVKSGLPQAYEDLNDFILALEDVMRVGGVGDTAFMETPT